MFMIFVLLEKNVDELHVRESEESQPNSAVQ